MLKPGPIAAAFALAILGRIPEARAQSDDGDDALRRPEKITVGINDQFIGQLSPDETTLYFVSNRATRKEIYAQKLADGRARKVFDEGAEVTWPRISPDGRALLYISFRDQATGQLCVRDLPDLNRRCLEDKAAALQAEWIDRNRIVLVSRTSIRGNLRVSEVNVAEGFAQRTLFDQNRTSPAVSPDGRFLVYVPLERVAKRVGPGFAARAAHRLEVVRLDTSGDPQPLVVDLPGITAQPAFSRDGRFLYFVQFLTDSNRDGIIDADDNGVLFRLPLLLDANDAPSRVALEMPQQLTDSRLNCQYPAPAASRLIATCSRGQDLDIYEMPLEGAVPDNWTKERLRVESELATRPTVQLLIYRQRLARETQRTSKRLLLMRMIMMHLELEEFDAAEFYVKELSALRERATRGIGQPMRALVAHRRAKADEERGRSVDTFTDDSKILMEQLLDSPKDSKAARILNRVVRSEIADSIGDKAVAKKELESVEIDAETPRSILEVYYARADALYRELDDREALASVGRRLASTPALEPDDRLYYARAAVRALIRGLPFDEADAVLARERPAETDDTEFGFALDLIRTVHVIREGRPPREVRHGLTAFYDKQTRPERKRAIVFEGVERAAEAGADSIIEALSQRYIDDAPKGTEERRRAERLYKRAALGRAFRHLARGRFDKARDDFDAVVQRTGALEAVVGSIDLRLHQGEPPEKIEAALIRDSEGNAPLANFIKAYLIASSLPSLDDKAHAEAVAEARALLRAKRSELNNSGPVRALKGFLMHETYVRTGDPVAAERADSQYMTALELVARDKRYLAAVLGQLGLLHTQVGNYRIALGYFERRATLPFNGDLEEFVVRSAMARALLHADKEEESAKMADEALSLVDKVETLKPYRIFALDRAALYNLAAGRFSRALALYDIETGLLAKDDGAPSRRNRFVVRLARAAAAIGAGRPRRARDDIAAIAPSLEDPRFVETLISKHQAAEETIRSYSAIVAGLRANANLALDQPEKAAAAFESRRSLLAERAAKSNRIEDVRALILVEARLAANALTKKSLSTAAKWAKSALVHADTLAEREGDVIDVDQLRVLWLCAEMQTIDNAPVDADIQNRLTNAQEKLEKLRDPSYKIYKRRFEIYRVLSEPRLAEPSK